MEVGVRLIGAVQLFISILLWPYYFMLSRRKKTLLPSLKSPFLQMSAVELAKKIRNKEVKSRAVVEAFIQRIREVNPMLNGLVEDRFAAALEDAERTDEFLANTDLAPEEVERRTPLLGVPFTVKESCGLKGFSHSVGSLPRKGIIAEDSGVAVKAMIKAGGIPLCITTTPEYCMSWETTNLITGTTNNPYNILKTSGGSSGGEGVFLGSAASVLGVGSDIAGSIRIPSMYNGIYGHKPSPGTKGFVKGIVGCHANARIINVIVKGAKVMKLYGEVAFLDLVGAFDNAGHIVCSLHSKGAVPITGHFPYSTDQNFQNFLAVGPMARYAEDLKVALKIMTGDNGAALKLEEEVNLSNVNVFYKEDAGFSLVAVPVDWEIKKGIHDAVNFLKQSYNCNVSEAKIKELEISVEISGVVFLGMEGIPDIMDASPKTKNGKGNLYTEMWKAYNGKSELSLVGLTFMLLVKYNLFIPRSKYSYYCKLNEDLRKKFNDLLKDNGVFIYPTFPVSALYHNQTFSKTAGIMYTMIFNTLQLPSTHVPIGLDRNGLPIGFQVIAGEKQDRLCLAVAKALEAKFGGWVPPPMVQ